VRSVRRGRRRPERVRRYGAHLRQDLCSGADKFRSSGRPDWRDGGGTVKLTKFLKKKLRPGTTLDIRVTKPNTIGERFLIKIRKKKKPTLTISQIA
jgi:hypothetical protein